MSCCRYDDVVTFLDPITKYNNVQGYMFNIRMLKSGEWQSLTGRERGRGVSSTGKAGKQHPQLHRAAYLSTIDSQACCCCCCPAVLLLLSVFSPVFELHDIKQTGPLEATTRWTMTMKVCGGGVS